jgi:hypothetical protein
VITAQELISAAQSQTCLTDFGPGADYMREGLERLVSAVFTDLKLSETGEAAFRARQTSYLANRLEIEHWYRKHPEIEDEQIISPVFGLGLPRTGSTYLQCLMAQDPAARSLRAWESEKPCPPPTFETQDTDPRIAEIEAARGGSGEIARLAPEILAMLPREGVNDPNECHDLLSLTFRGHSPPATILFSFIDWQTRNDMVPAYLYHKRTLKLLQWRCPPKKWRLKSPVHMDALPALQSVYPDARFVVTHRDVDSVMPSMAALLYFIHSPYVDGIDKKNLGAQTVRRWKVALDAMDSFRDRQDKALFFDVGALRAQSESSAVLREMYEWLGEAFTPTFEQRMEKWRAERPKNKHGSVKIDMADYGLSVVTLHQTFARYLERYQAYIAA